MPDSESKLQAATLGGTPDDVEHAFYEALQTGDIEKLMACWADEDDVVCIHPGGTRLVGVGSIRASFDTMFGHGGSIHTTPHHVRRVQLLATAVHHVVERVEIMADGTMVQAYVLSTNVYCKTAQGWRILVHHASPGSPDQPEEGDQAPQVLH